jgi:hypothetical protein
MLTARVALGTTVAVAVSVVAARVFVMATMGVNVGSSMEVAMIGGNGVGVGCSGGVFSASERDMPPSTSRSETTAIMSPPLISRKARMVISPLSWRYSWRWAAAH